MSQIMADPKEGHTVKKIFALILAICMVFALCACGTPDRDIRAEHDQIVEDLKSPAPTEEPEDEAQVVHVKRLPTATSEDVELYIVQEAASAPYVVNAYGQKASGYTIDNDGNILDRQGEILVAADNAYFFQRMDTIAFSQREYNATLIAKEEKVAGKEDETEIVQHPTTITIFLTATPKETTNGVIVLGSSNAGIVEIRANNNAKIIADGAFELRNGEIAIDIGTTGSAKIVVTAKTDGQATISARSLSGTASAECVVSVKEGEVEKDDDETATDTGANQGPVTEMINASDNPAEHVHSYTKTVVDPTAYEQGYTLYTCSCGHSYKDNFVPATGEPQPSYPPHVHNYESSVIAPTATERGYTLHVCHEMLPDGTECGDSYKDCYVDPTG